MTTNEKLLHTKEYQFMKRDMDLVRQVLIKMEEHEHGNIVGNFEIDGYSEEQIGYHCYLLDQAGLIHAIDMSSDDDESPCAMPRCLTWSGHEFIENAKNENNWLQAKAAVGKIGDASFSVWVSVLTSIVTKSLGI
jgi:Hypothetical protein (DUF2513)